MTVLAAGWLAMQVLAAQPAPEAPAASAPASPVATQPLEVDEDAAEGLPSGPRPYTEVGPSTAGSPVRPRSAVDTPALPQRGMSGEAWGDSVRSRLQAAQARQGSLDGGWTVTDAAGQPLFQLQLVDAPGAELEGVWREAPRPGINPASGLFATAARQGAQTILSFEAPRGGGSAELALSAGASGWEGALTLAGQTQPVRLLRAPVP